VQSRSHAVLSQIKKVVQVGFGQPVQEDADVGVKV
jgi:hypothetical protein